MCSDSTSVFASQFCVFLTGLLAAAQLPTFVTFVSFAVRFCAFGGRKSVNVPFVLVDFKNLSWLYAESLSILRCFKLTSVR